MAALLLIASPMEAVGAETKSFVVNWFNLASYFSDGDCPAGLNPKSAEFYRRDLLRAGHPQQEVEIVRRIFRDYAARRSPETIAKELNREQIAGPGGREWSNTTIRGQSDRGTGILNNAVYRGVLDWNRCSYVKDPRTGRRVART